MPTRCMEFVSIAGSFGAILVLSIMLSILSWAIAPLGAIGKLIITCLRVGLGLYGLYITLNWWGSILGMRGSCPQGYWTPWPVISGSNYQRDPVTGLRTDEPTPSIFSWK